ncbi:hypothetical protein B4U37_21125 [Sutcliffiella horikoshii]|nr:hypothetical protein B4U37_21125 [Sutcliffiella horikoshii]
MEFLELVDWSGSHLTPAGDRGKRETPQAKPRRLSALPEESKWLLRKETGQLINGNLCEKTKNKKGRITLWTM